MVTVQRSARLVEHRRDHAGVERDVAAQVEFVGDPVQVAQDLGLGGVLLGPVPLLLQFVGERVAVVDALDVTACAGIPVVVPGAAELGRGLEHPHRETLGCAICAGHTDRRTRRPRPRRRRRCSPLTSLTVDCRLSEPRIPGAPATGRVSRSCGHFDDVCSPAHRDRPSDSDTAAVDHVLSPHT